MKYLLTLLLTTNLFSMDIDNLIEKMNTSLFDRIAETRDIPLFYKKNPEYKLMVKELYNSSFIFSGTNKYKKIKN